MCLSSQLDALVTRIFASSLTDDMYIYIFDSSRIKNIDGEFINKLSTIKKKEVVN